MAIIETLPRAPIWEHSSHSSASGKTATSMERSSYRMRGPVTHLALLRSGQSQADGAVKIALARLHD